MRAAKSRLLRVAVAIPLLAGGAMAEAPTPPPPVATATPRQQELEQILASLASLGGGRVGIAAIDVGSGRMVAVHGNEPFPMASTYKVAVAATFLHAVEMGQFRIDGIVEVDPDDRFGSDRLRDEVPGPGMQMGAMSLIGLMLRYSDNSATDTMLRLIGGPAAVARWLRSAGLAGLRVDRNTAELILESEGHTADPGATAAATIRRRGGEGRTPINPAFDADPRDSSTPVAMAVLLARLARGELLNSVNTGYLLGVMERCETGGRRARAFLPEGTRFAHKTGTLAGIGNDVGVLTLSDGRRVALAIFVRGIYPVQLRNAIAAEAGRTLYEGMARLP